MRNNILNYLTCFILVLTFQKSFAQEQKTNGFSKAIEDNSYLIEEAYNQEDRVVQHIFNTYNERDPKSYFGTFTQEWPVFSQKHQFSYMLPYTSLVSGAQKGLGDIMLNYRFQLTGHDDFITLSPRFSLILPTGDADKGLGNGTIGYQINIPCSKRLSEYLVIHANAGLTMIPNFDYGLSEKKNNLMYSVGASAIVLVNQNFNVMLEYLNNFVTDYEANGNKKMNTETYLNPGVRFAFDLGKAQIVPGFSVPIFKSNVDNK